MNAIVDNEERGRVCALLARPFVNRLGLRPAPVPTVRDIIRLVCTSRALPVEDVLGRKRLAHLVAARQEIYHRCIVDLGKGPTDVGRVVGRDRSTVLNGAERYLIKQGAVHG